MTENDILWDRNGVVLVNGVPLKGSNVTQLVNDAVREKQPVSKPTVYHSFAKIKR
jgi:hypothetical protein